MWAELGGPTPFGLIEYGAGSGTLALSILDGLRRHGCDRPAGRRPIRADRIEPEPACGPARQIRKGRPCRGRMPATSSSGTQPRPRGPADLVGGRARHRRHPCQRVPRRPARPPLRRPWREAARALRRVAGGLRRGRRPSHPRPSSPHASPSDGIDARRARGGPGRRDMPRPRPVARRGRRAAWPAATSWPSTTATRPASCTALAASPARCSAIAAIACEENPFVEARARSTSPPTWTSPPSSASGSGAASVPWLTRHAVGVPRRRRPGGGAAGAPGVARNRPSPTTCAPAPASSACSTPPHGPLPGPDDGPGIVAGAVGR